MEKKSGGSCGKCGVKLPCKWCDFAEKISAKFDKGSEQYWNKKKKGDKNG